ncbi:hypothetical protein FJZ36_06905 [Candidatus Poribacteria bacterium]|nr:hypothetical protein [Candidatus Poribacteria bacterium]
MTLLGTVLSLAYAAPAPAVNEWAAGYADTLADFVADFDRAAAENTLETSVSNSQSGGIAMPSIFQHPREAGDARLTYEVALPEDGGEARLILAFALGLRDGVRLDDPKTPVDGVLCGISVDGHRVFEAIVHEPGWREHSVDLTPLAGRTVQLTFTANNNGTPNYDWLLWGNPRLYRLWTETKKTAPSRLSAGLALLTGHDGRASVRRFLLDRAEAVEDAVDDLASEWRGESIQRIELFAFLPKVAIRSLSSAQHLLFAGKDYTVRCAVENVGDAPVEDFHQISAGISGAALRRGRAERSIGSLDIGEVAQLSWHMRGSQRRDSVDVTVSLKSALDGIVGTPTRTASLRFQRALPPLPARTSNEVRSVIQSDYALLENSNVRIAFVENDGAFHHFVLFAQKGNHLQQVATSMPISRVVYLDRHGEAQSLDLVPTRITMGGSSDGDASLLLSSQQTDDDGVVWDFEAAFTLYDESKRIRTRYRIRPSEKRRVLHFAGPMLRVGDGTDGDKKEFALFPGLEFLEGDEVSSSTRDAAPPINTRLVPHPYKITIPIMAVQQGETTTGVLWDPLSPWGRDGKGLSPLFASPNWFDGQDNHLIGVFLPTVPDWVGENEVLSREGYVVSELPLELRAQIFTDSRGTILDIPDIWVDAYGYPKPEDAPRSDEEEVALSRHGFLVSAWDEETRKSRHCVDWAPANAPGFATLLWYDYLATGDPSARERVELIARQTLEEQGPAGLASPANCHILRWEFPFYYGHLPGAIVGARQQVQGMIASQKDDGSWRFNPTSDQTRSLGEAGDAVIGTCAGNALRVLKFARVTGDERALRSGIKALEFMDRFAVPRGAQGWECPLYEPDILAAAYAVGAYLEAHAITGEAVYLEKAEYWARTGLPFLYFWNVPDRPGMRFGSIPVFGTTFYTHSWFGVPVQWNGLVYAYYVQRLSRFSDYPWRQVAEGVTMSAMHQQWTDGKLKGTYPDGFYGFCTEGKGPHINPEDIMVNLFAVRGHDPDISTGIVTTEAGERIHVSSGARVSDVETRNEQLRFTLSGLGREDAHVLVGNLSRMTGARVDGEPIEERGSLAEGPGWLYDAEQGLAFLRVPQERESHVVVLDWFIEAEEPESAVPSESQETDEPSADVGEPDAPHDEPAPMDVDEVEDSPDETPTDGDPLNE